MKLKTKLEFKTLNRNYLNLQFIFALFKKVYVLFQFFSFCNHK